MQSVPVLIYFFLLYMLYTTDAQIPYSYATGRDEAAVERRFAAFNAAKIGGASRAELNTICGVVRSVPACTTPIGRPTNAETDNCDSACCHLGFKVGNCGRNLEGPAISQLSINSVLADLVTSVAQCHCSNDRRVVRCGNDGSWHGIRCPFDTSSCWRKCCREGRAGGKCGGFLRTRCKCHD